MAINWNEDYSVKVKEIDDQHKKFIGIMNELYLAIAAMKVKEEAVSILNELIRYAEIHFATEEKYFDLYHYEFAEEHKQKHQELRDKLSYFKDISADEEKKIELLGEFTEFLEDWLVDHLASQDQKYTQCFNDHGLF